MATSTFIFPTENLLGYSGHVYMVPAGQTVNALMPLTEDSSRQGQYFRANVTDGEYKIYIDIDKSGSPVESDLYKNSSGDYIFYHGDKRLSIVAYSFDEEGRLLAEKAAFITRGKNLFNKNSNFNEPGHYIHYQSGEALVNASYLASHYIPVSPATQYTRSYVHQLAFYDQNKVYISGISDAAPANFTTPVNCAYVRLTIQNSYVDNFQLELGDTPTGYEVFRYKGENDNAPVTSDIITDNTLDIFKGALTVKEVQTKHAAFLVKGKNLFNINDSGNTPGYYVFAATGALLENENYWASHYIIVEPGQQYTRSFAGQMAFYNSDKDFISGDDSSATVTAPTGALYARLSIHVTLLHTFQFEKGSSATTFESHRLILNSESDIFGGPALYRKLAGTMEIALPATIYLRSEAESSIYWDNIISLKAQKMNFARLEPYSFGANFLRCFRWIPQAADIGLKSGSKVALYDWNFDKIEEKPFEVIVADKNNSTAAKILCIGDSYTQAGHFLKRLNDTLSNLTFLGTRDSSVGPNCEGRGGWTLNDYLTRKHVDEYDGIFSPFLQPVAPYLYYGTTDFWKKVQSNPTGYAFQGFQNICAAIGFSATTGLKTSPNVNDVMYNTSNSRYEVWTGTAWTAISESTLNFSLDFARYASAWGVQTPSIATIMLGINDFRTTLPNVFEDTIVTWKANMSALITAIKAWNTNIKIVLCIPPAGANQDGFNYDTNFAERYKFVLWKLAKEIIAEFDGKQSQKIYLSDMYAALDRDYGIDKNMSQLPFGLYTGTERENVMSNDVHPSVDGYYQMADRLAGVIQYIR